MHFCGDQHGLGVHDAGKEKPVKPRTMLSFVAATDLLSVAGSKLRGLASASLAPKCGPWNSGTFFCTTRPRESRQLSRGAGGGVSFGHVRKRDG